MDGIDGTNPALRQTEADLAAADSRDLESGQQGLTEEQVVEAWTPAVMAVTQAALLYLFPEARRIQQVEQQISRNQQRLRTQARPATLSRKAPPCAREPESGVIEGNARPPADGSCQCEFGSAVLPRKCGHDGKADRGNDYNC